MRGAGEVLARCWRGAGEVLARSRGLGFTKTWASVEMKTQTQGRDPARKPRRVARAFRRRGLTLVDREWVGDDYDDSMVCWCFCGIDGFPLLLWPLCSATAQLLAKELLCSGRGATWASEQARFALWGSRASLAIASASLARHLPPPGRRLHVRYLNTEMFHYCKTKR